MPNIYLDDNFPTHPKIVQAGSAAAWLYVCGLAYCSRYLTGGHIPRAVLGQLTDQRNVLNFAGKLTELALWDAVSDGWNVHDYDTYNAKQLSRRRQAKGAAQARWAQINLDAPRNAPRNASSIAQPDAPRNAPSNALRTNEHKTSLTSVEHSRPRALTDEDEDRIETEARRRMNQLPTAPNHPTAWLAAAKANIRREHDQNIRWQPKDPPNAQRRDYDHPNPQCKTCGSTGWLEVWNSDAFTRCQACNA